MAASRPDATKSTSTGRPLQELLTEAKLRVCIAPHQHKRRLEELAALSAGFVALTTLTAVSIAKEYHVAKGASGGEDGAKAALEAAIRKIRPDGSLALVSGGMAGGIKVLDSRDHAFFKISEDQDGIYGGSLVMADKPAKHELSALSFLHDAVDATHLTLPLASCLDVTERGRDGGKARVYRVQAFSALPISRSTLRSGSSDACETVHVCDAMLEPLRDVAERMHLAPAPPPHRPSDVVVHSYERRMAATRDPSLVPTIGPAMEAVLEELGVGRHAAECSGECRELEAANGGVVLDPFRGITSVYSPSSTAEARESGRGPRDFTGVGGASLALPLPFDVEGHMLPTGERCLVDTHRLCIPETAAAGDRDASVVAPTVLLAVRASGRVDVLAGDMSSPESVDTAVSMVGVTEGHDCQPRADATVHDVMGTGCKVVTSRGSSDLVLVARPSEYWRAAHLTALFPATAGAVLREAGVPPVSPDGVMAAGATPDIDAASRHLLGPANLAKAAEAVRACVAESEQSGSHDVVSLRAAVKAGLHSRGLGLRHVGLVWAAVTRSSAPAGSSEAESSTCAALGANAVAIVSACLPRHGSSAGLALEQLCDIVRRTGTGHLSETVACLAARTCAVKGRGFSSAELKQLAEQVLSCSASGRAMRSWLFTQRRTTVSVKTGGLDGQGKARLGGLMAGEAGDAAAAKAQAALLRELNHRQRCGQTVDRDVRRRLVDQVRRKVSSIAVGVLAGVPLWGAGKLDAGDSFDQLGALTSIAMVMHESSNLQAALEACEEALRVKQASLHPDHPSVGSTWSNIGVCRFGMGEYASALEAFDQALRIQQESLHPDHPDVGTTWGNIGICRSDMGKYASALKAHNQALRIQQASLRPDHPSVGSTWGNIGNCRFGMGEYASALEAHDRALRIQQPSLGPDHPYVGTTWGNIGACRSDMGKYASALEAYDRALRVKQASLGQDHPSVGSTWGNIGNCRSDMGEYALALKAHNQALRIQQASLHPDHPSVGTTWGNIGVCRSDMGEYASALEAHEEALRIQQASLGPDHHEVGTTWGNIGACRSNMGEYASALKAHEEALRIQQASLRPDHPSVGTTWGNIGNCRSRMGEHESAVEAHNRALRIQQASLRPDHPSVGRTWGIIGNGQCRMGEYASALKAYEEALRIQQASHGPDHPYVGSTWCNIGVCQFGMGEYASALEAYDRALRIQQASLRPDHPLVRKTRGNISKCRSRMGEHAWAREAHDRALRIQQASQRDGSS